MSQEWYYVQGGQQVGPVTFEQLQEVVARREIRHDDLVWREGMADWQPAETVEGLLPPSGAAGPGAVRMSSRRGPAGPGRPAPGRQGSGRQGYGRQAGRHARGSARARYSSRQGVPGIVITGFVLSLVGLIFCGLPSTIGMILCIAGLGEAKRRGGYGLAIAGIVIGAMVTILILVYVVLVFIVGASGGFQTGGGY